MAARLRDAGAVGTVGSLYHPQESTRYPGATQTAKPIPAVGR